MARLDPVDIDRLDRYLGDHCAPVGGLPDSEALDGFLSAVVAGPELVSAGEWMPVVWGTDHAFADEMTAREMAGLLMRAYNIVVDRVRDPAALGEPTDDLLPLVAYPDFDPEGSEGPPDMDDNGFLVGALWAHGFRLGCELRAKAWDQRVADWEGLDEILLDIDSLTLGVGDDQADEDPDEPLPTLAQRLQLVQAIPALLHTLYRDALSQGGPPVEPFRRESPKTGRNDRCPCGSGRKYKHCHGT